jgi:TctA family transporter
MARRGEAARALSLCATTSLFGALIAICWLILLLPVVRSSVLMVGPPEFFMMILFGLVVVIIANRANMLKGLVSAGIGVLLSFIGFSPLTGVSRFTFGSERYLWDGIGLIPFFVGVFAFGEIIRWGLQGAGGTIAPPERLQLGLKQVVAGVKDVFRYPVALVRSSAIGMVIGIIPGVGGVISNFLAYTTAIQFSRTPQLFGTGSAEGLVLVAWFQCRTVIHS